MSKKKRVRRDLDKFFRVGRYWDLLRLLESEGLVSEHAREHREAWNVLVKQAFKQERSFREFSREVETLKVLPKDPDFQLLMHIKTVIERGDSNVDLAQLKGLSPEAERFKANFNACLLECSRLNNLKRLIEKFIREPDKITRRYYEQVADFLAGGPIEGAVRRLGESIPLSRGFNNKAAVARGWDGIALGRLGMLDSRLSRISQSVPGALLDILLHPFVHNLAVMCRRLAPEANSHNASNLLRSLPFLLRRLVGDRMEEIERKLLTHQSAWVAGGDDDPTVLSRKVGGMTLEDKVTLLNGLRQRIREAPEDESPFDELDFFDEEEEEEDNWDDEDGSRNLAPALLVLHRSILKDIALRSGALSPRDKRELVRVMEPLLLRDLDYVVAKMEGPEDFLAFLSSVVGSGCGGTRVGLLALLAGAYYRDGDLRRVAEGLLDQTPPPTGEDFGWLAREWIELYYPTVRSLKPLLKRYRTEKTLLTRFNSELCSAVEHDLYESMVKAEVSRFPLALMDLFGSSKPKEPGLLRRELVELQEYEELNPVRQFLQCYSEDRLTREGHLCWLNTLHAGQAEVTWKYALDDLKRCERMEDDTQTLLPLRVFGQVLNDRIEAVLLFMIDHPDDLATLPLDILDPLMETLMEYPENLLDHYTLLIHFEKILTERLLQGEEACRLLRDGTKKLLLELARQDKKTGKTRKKKK